MYLNIGDIIFWGSSRHIFYGIITHEPWDHSIYKYKTILIECKSNNFCGDPRIHKTVSNWGYTANKSSLSFCTDPQKIEAVLEALLKI